MPQLTHHTRNIRLAPRKVRFVIDKIRGLTAEQALETLPRLNRRAALPVAKAVKAAMYAAADKNLEMSSLTIARIWADEGAALKRVIRFSRGRSAMIMKKYSHIGMVLEGNERARATKAPKTKKTETAAAAPKEGAADNGEKE